MKKKDKTLTEYSAFYDPSALDAFLILFVVTFAGYLWIILTKQEYPKGAPFQSGMGYLVCVSMPYYTFPLVLFFLRRRMIDGNGVAAKYLGMRYKYISWENLMSYCVKSHASVVMRGKKSNYRAAFFFTSKPNHKGKSTIIIIYATKEARALAEKYFGPPAFVQEGVVFDGKDER